MKPTGLTAFRWTLTIGVLTWTTGTLAQDAVMAAPETKLTAPVLRNSAPAPQSQPADPSGAFFSLGPVSLHPHLLARYMYGMGLPTTDGRRVASHRLPAIRSLDVGSSAYPPGGS